MDPQPALLSMTISLPGKDGHLPQQEEASKEKSEGDYLKVTDELRDAISWLRRFGFAAFSAAVAAAVAVVWLLIWRTDIAIREIVANPANPMVAIYELIRSAAFAAVVGAVLFGLFSLAKASVDQATRFQKRLMAAHFMHFVLIKYDHQISSSKIGVGEVVQFIEAWSKNVESAFTGVRFAAKKADATRIAAGPFVYEEGLNPQPKPVDRHSKGAWTHVPVVDGRGKSVWALVPTE